MTAWIPAYCNFTLGVNVQWLMTVRAIRWVTAKRSAA